MHPLETGMGVPAFLAKLWRLVEDADTNNLISWSTDGRSFIIQNQAQFAKELLPLNYKHNNMASFIRQLNMYGFHKITSIDNGGLKFDRDEMEFSHPYFQKGHPYLLEHIKRKIAHPKQVESDKIASKVETVNRVLHEVKNMRGRQESLDTRFSAMKQENEALWREVAILRQKHMKQQQIVNKLIQFLVTMVQPTRSGLGSSLGKRRYQLMINDAPKTKIKKTNAGPIISELTEELLDEVDSDLEMDPINFTNVQSPGSDSQSSKDQDAVNSADSADDLNLDDIDEIDTNNMAIYSGAPILKKDRNGSSGGKVFTGPDLQQQMKEEPKDINNSVIFTNTPESKKEKKSTLGGKVFTGTDVPLQKMKTEPKKSKSLLITSQNKASDQAKQNQPRDDLMNLLKQSSNDHMVAGTSGAQTAPVVDPVVGQNIFDENSQPPENILADDDMFEKSSNKLTITKYNPQTTEDIMKLNSHTDYSNHLENVQNDLDSLKDLLSTDSYQLDANQLLGNGQLPMYMSQGSYDADTINKLFGSDDIVGYELPLSNVELFAIDKKDDSQSGARSELMAYQPSPYNNSLDLNELLQNADDVETVE